ncbi:sorbosone dehydrogenase family protein [Patulibacter sp.]|uniref:PQQ-dependent sugar dehydrogenase n=1 Tax=Patulibacter sp. TaxID=1912859 RepID=UPI00271EA555|nr:PQQ-dependent sugar dehydrogenase [Patulibacter sp.]MDO9410023.1 PQQ-dependent sugar dehydrogenase [Patulibacter sp.]
MLRLATTSAIAAVAVLGLTACGSSSDDAADTTASDGDVTSMAATTAAEAPSASGSTTGAGDAAQPRAVSVRSTIATGLNTPWSIVFLPDDSALVSERGGVIKRIAKNGRRATTLARVPGVVEGGEGGLLGLAVSPTYAKDRLVYAYLTTSRDNRIVRFRLTASTRRIQPRTVLTGLESAQIHNGGRLAFGPDGKLYATVGDAGNTSASQDRGSQNGKILRMNPTGSVPSDNPIEGSRVWSLGHRNPQGLAFDRSGRLWAPEFGQNTFDEVNLIEKGKNYGWPEIEGRGDTDGGRYTNPQVTWRTSESSPSGAAIVGSRLYVAGLGGERLWTIPLRGARAGKATASLVGRYGRIRAVTAAPDGSLWIGTSNRDGRGEVRSGDDRILRVSVGG